MNTLPKYQAWHGAEKKMHQVFSIRMEETDHLAQLSPIHVLVKDPAASAFFGASGISAKFFDLSEVKLREYTGLKDCKGNEAYGDDIVKLFDRSLFVVAWSKDYARFQLNMVKGEEIITVYDMSMVQFSEIVGNVYEHSHLLSKESPNDQQ